MLAPENRELLAFEEQHPAPTGKKADLILFRFGLTAINYYGRLRCLSTQQDAVEAFPMVCKRIQRQMRKRSAQRQALLDITSAV